jgi:flavin reductase (DIM6/NTAB) family NADH-FMN oxidoreductase RutF
LTDSFAFADLPPRDRYKLLCGVIVPRPIALVTSVDADGIVNAAPFSFFNVFSEDPALIVLGLQHKPDRSAKDTPATSRGRASSWPTSWTRR